MVAGCQNLVAFGLPSPEYEVENKVLIVLWWNVVLITLL